VDHKYTVGAIQFTITEGGTLQYFIPANGVRDWEMNPQSALDFIGWLTTHQNYFALSKIHGDQRIAMLADIAGITNEKPELATSFLIEEKS
jgi:hypothetical protein